MFEVSEVLANDRVKYCQPASLEHLQINTSFPKSVSYVQIPGAKG
jgi:hypothetical protein